MIRSQYFVDLLVEKGFGPFIYVPCSYLRSMIGYIEDEYPEELMIVNNEGEALAIASGMYLAGRMPVVMAQNSGLGNMVNPLTSLNYIFKIPILLLISQRGEKGTGDQPQHMLMGQITLELLDLIKICNDYLPENEDEIEQKLFDATNHMSNQNLPFAFVVKKNSFESYYSKKTTSNDYSNRKDDILHRNLTTRNIIKLITNQTKSDLVLISTTGYISRELFFCNEREGNLYIIGSMGCASSIALGIALGNRNKRVIVLDGDGAALMRLEAMVSIGHYIPENYIHIILDNRVYASTGGQSTLSSSVNFIKIASACGYRTVVSISEENEFCKELSRCLGERGPNLIHTQVLYQDEINVGRPTLLPSNNKERIIDFLEG